MYTISGHHLDAIVPAGASATELLNCSSVKPTQLCLTLPTLPSPLPGFLMQQPTGQLFLDLRAPASPQEADSLTDPILPPGLQLVGGTPEHQVAQGPSSSLLDVLIGAAEEVHQLADAPQLRDLPRKLPTLLVQRKGG